MTFNIEISQLIKQNRTFFHGTYSNQTPYLLFSKNVEVF